MEEEAKTSAAAPARGWRRYLYPALIFGLGFVAAFFLARYIFMPDRPADDGVPVGRVVKADELRGMFQAADQGDFSALERIGAELFVPGNRIPDSKKLLEPYAVPSFPPHQVYAFLTRIGGAKSQRVLLTMDDNDAVVSFMAEETEIVR